MHGHSVCPCAEDIVYGKWYIAITGVRGVGDPCGGSPIDLLRSRCSARLLAAYESGKDQWLINTRKHSVPANRVRQKHDEFLVTGSAERDLGSVFSILRGISHSCTREVCTWRTGSLMALTQLWTALGQWIDTPFRPVLTEGHVIKGAVSLADRQMRHVRPRTSREERADSRDARHGAQVRFVIVSEIRHVVRSVEEGCLRCHSTASAILCPKPYARRAQPCSVFGKSLPSSGS